MTRVRELHMVLVAALLAGVLMVAPAGGAAAPPGGKGPNAPSACPNGSTARVVLDPGHGGADTGAVYAGLVEKDLTLDIANRAAGILQTGGVSVALTRYGDESLGNSERGEIANACNAEVFVSIHLNASSNAEVNYTKTFWGKRRKDEAFSQVMHQALYETLAPGTNLTAGGTGQFATGSLLQASMPGTLAETVFLSNPEEQARLADPTSGRRDQIAQGIALGVLRHLGLA